MNHREAEQLDVPELERVLRERVGPALPGWLERQRWFSDKGRGIVAVTIDDCLIRQVDGDWLALTIARVRFTAGDDARYFLPIAFTRSPSAAEAIAPGSASAGTPIDATATPWFGGWLVRQMAAGAQYAAGAWEFAPAPGAAATIAAAGEIPAALVRAEQTNSSLRFGDELMVKLFRRLQPGPNPDEEVLRALAAAEFERVPRFCGAAGWRGLSGEEYPLALAQAYVRHVADGWSWILSRLDAIARGEIALAADGFVAERLLGRRTAELHRALRQLEGADFRPRPLDAAGAETARQRTAAAIEAANGLIRRHEARLPVELRARLPSAGPLPQGFLGRADGYHDEVGWPSIRVHGDYHLGQTLRTPDDDWVIIDFEGEPARPVAERRQRTSPLKDVAGMLRSFAYARGAAERARISADDESARACLRAWETGARQAFLEGYREIALEGSPLVVADEQRFARALQAWELDKALYEIAYEARNRPDWLELPLRTLLPDLDQPDTAAGAAPA